MRSELLCELRKTGKTCEAIGYPYGLVLHNVLLANENIELDKEVNHTFKLVVNKKGSLTLLCIK